MTTTGPEFDRLIDAIDVVRAGMPDHTVTGVQVAEVVAAAIAWRGADAEQQQPPADGFCEDCGHLAGRHDAQGCHWPGRDCSCPGMLWQGQRWLRPWWPAPEGLHA